MTLQVYCKNQNDHFSLSMFFDLNGQEYNIIDTSDQNITVSDGVNSINLVLYIFHNFESQAGLIKDTKKTEEICITNMYNNDGDTKIIFNDFLFNAVKAYNSQFPFSRHTKKWYHHGQLSYIIPVHPTADAKTKIYVSPGKTYNGIRKYRLQLIKFLKENFLNIGYIGNYDDDPTLFLYPHIEFPMTNDIATLELATRPMSYDSWGYCPPHNEYYKNTFISIYGETIEYGNSIAVTEKTFDPLIKGHFILPFSTTGFIQHLKNQYNFKFPDFIDYTYDTIKNNDLRYQAYHLEVKRLLGLDINVWRQHWNDNFESIIRHNQLVFHNKPYDRIDFYKLLKGI